MEGESKIPMDEARARRAFRAILVEILRLRRSIVKLYLIVRADRRKLKELEKKVSSFVEPS